MLIIFRMGSRSDQSTLLTNLRFVVFFGNASITVSSMGVSLTSVLFLFVGIFDTIEELQLL